MDADVRSLGASGLGRFQELRADAVSAVTDRFYKTYGHDYSQYGARGREACFEDLNFHLEFLRPVLEFGLLQPLVDYLHWLASVLAARGIPAEHLPLSLDWLAEFFCVHMEAEDAQIVATATERAKIQFLQTGSRAVAADSMVPEPLPECEAFESALLAGDRRGAQAILKRVLEEGRGLVAAELHLIQPALYGIGLKWQNNQVSVAQEHLATAISQSLMMHALLSSQVGAATGHKVLLSCVEGNNHSVGLQMVGDAFQLAGWEVQFLGVNVPTNALLQQVGRFKPDILGLSISFAQQLRALKQIMLRLAATARPAVIVGGLAINRFHRLAGELGADAWSRDALSAIESAAGLLTQAGSR
jgi:methanogenic corrinoid protein MtbC1